jgi:DNA polymerase III subunit epsilon
MSHLIMTFDTETNGRPAKKKRGEAKPTMRDVDDWPRVIELAWSLSTPQGERVSQESHLIRPDGWEIPTEPFWQEHAFSTTYSLAEGKPFPFVGAIFLADIQKAAVLVAHNMEFDYNVLGAELIRYGLKGDRKPFRICTMTAARDHLRLPFPNQKRPYRFQKNWHPPRLEQMYEALFNAPLTHKHRAAGDRDATERCLFELVRRGVIRLPPHPNLIA